MNITKWLFCFVVLFGVCLSGCTFNSLQGDTPPNVYIGIADKSYPAKLGTYCWQERCVDTSGPIDMLKDSETIKVEPEQTIKFMMDFEPPPTTIELSIFRENEEEVSIELQDVYFSAPTQKGIYYYSYSLRWQKDELSIGDAHYAFALEVD